MVINSLHDFVVAKDLITCIVSFSEELKKDFYYCHQLILVSFQTLLNIKKKVLTD